MSRFTPKQVRRLLAARPTPAPPASLADRIKAEIPGSIRLDGAAVPPGRRWLLPSVSEGLRPSWLAAASLLLVAGVGVVAAYIPAQPDDVWKWLALSGVVHIDDIVVTVPAAPSRAALPSPGESAGAAAKNGVTIVVLDERGHPCAGASVTLEPLGGAGTQTWTATTGGGGAAAFPAVEPASYRLRVSAPGIAPTQATVTVGADRAATPVVLHVRAQLER